MRPQTKILLVILISLFLISFRGFAGSTDTVKNDGPKLRNHFVFKADKKFLGATVEIVSDRGTVITSTSLLKRKLIIDFGDVHFGAYTIRLSKGDLTQEYIYINKEGITLLTQ